MDTLPPELVEGTIVNLPYHDLIKHCRTLKLDLCHDDQMWADKAERDFDHPPERFFNPNEIDTILLDGLASFGRFRYLQLLSRKGVTFGTEMFWDLRECIHRAIKVKQEDPIFGQDLLDYFIDKVDDVNDGLVYVSEMVFTGSLLAGDYPLFRTTSAVLESRHFFRSHQDLITQAAQGGNKRILLAITNYVKKRDDPDPERTNYLIAVTLLKFGHYDLFLDPDVVGNIDDDTRQDLLQLQQMLINPDQVDPQRLIDLVNQYGWSILFNSSIDPYLLLTSQPNVKTDIKWGSILAAALDQGDARFVPLMNGKYPIYHHRGISIPNTDMFLELVRRRQPRIITVSRLDVTPSKDLVAWMMRTNQYEGSQIQRNLTEPE